MQKVIINHAFLESGDQLLSNSKSCLENTWKIHFLIKILSLFQGNTLMIGDKYVLLFDNDLHIAYSEICYNYVWVFTLASRPYRT